VPPQALRLLQARRPCEPIVLAGDLNTKPQFLEMRLLMALAGV
jgi:hypothetical protein